MPKPQGRARAVWRVSWPMAALCLLAANRWLLESARPKARSTDLTEAAGCVMAAGVAMFGAVLRSGVRMQGALLTGNWRAVDMRSVVGGLAVLTGPAVALLISSRHVHADSATLALSLAPVIVAVALPAMGGTEGDLAARLWPGLAGLAGLLLLLPQPSLDDWRYDLALLCFPLLTGLGASYVTARRKDRPSEHRFPLSNSLLLVLTLVFAALIFAGLAWRAQHTGESKSFSASAAALDGLMALLTLLALRRLGAVRWSAQYLLIPLLTLLEGALLLRPVLDWRSWMAFALLAASSGYLLAVGRDRATIP